MDTKLSTPISKDSDREFPLQSELPLQTLLRLAKEGKLKLPVDEREDPRQDGDVFILDDDDDDPDPVFEMIEIGPFGRPDHVAGEFTDTWKDNEGYIQLRRFRVPAENFIVTSGGRPIYFFDGIKGLKGLWLGSEMIRRDALDRGLASAAGYAASLPFLREWKGKLF